jgi:hypothetical protein
MLAIVFCLLFPAPRLTEPAITEADLIGDFDLSWGALRQDLHFDDEAGWSRFGRGPWSVDSNRVDFEESGTKYRMELKKLGTGFIGVGYAVGYPGQRINVRMTRRE